MIIHFCEFVKFVLRIYEKKGVITIYEVFKAEVAKVKRLRHLTNADIGEMTGFKKNTIDFFMSSSEKKGRDDSPVIAAAISQALGIEL